MEHRQIVVVAEDDDELRELLVGALSGEGRQLVEVEDGSELLDYLEFIAARGVQATLPDLILTDVQMPGANGLDVVSWARARGVTCPFVILSGFADDRLRAAALVVGKTQVLSKPQSLAAIRAAADRALALPR
jgi:two-component system phosphate regulon response regulator PhoB